MKALFAYLAVLSMTMSQGANALTISTGADLQKACTVAEHFSACTSYMKVVFDTAKAIAHMKSSKSNGVIGSCGPEKGIDTVPLVIALRNAWQDYASKYPDRLRHLAVTEVLRAFERQWPCSH